MNKKYKVLVQVDVREYYSIEVEASDKGEAASTAISSVDSGDVEPSHTDVTDYSAYSVQEV